MKKAMTTCILSFSILVSGLLQQTRAIAEPAPLFQPLVEDIRQQLPKGLKIRLPAFMPESSIPLYPYIHSDKNLFAINIAITPDCATAKNSSSCTAGGFGVFNAKARNEPPKGDNVTPIHLGNGVKGFYFTRGSGENLHRYVFWQQDGLQYGLGVGGGTSADVTQQELIDIAASTVNEVPIVSTK
jgi:hypothetical protein